ncbi:acyltransferase [Nocardioides sp. GY 10113]|uniref:acyltransferase family protein n=1 Tax=Nocardioides sp. GY 10113 TaxID=2569761 RepID=UPI0010A8D5BF|nr:acyltransferase [Nocardioides sp. GY 10113]TIC88579.1 acyltransferase [Nocardioides sp. GY 10113]
MTARSGHPAHRTTPLETIVPPPPETGTQFPVLDTLRAVGALAVLTTHVAFWTGAYTRHGTWGALLARLDVGVALFFVLSGFLLGRPYLLRAAAGLGAPGTGRYLWKRFLRIYPLYAITVALALGLIHDNRGASPGDWLTTLLMLDNHLGYGFPAGLTHMWSLAVEVAFYLVLPLLMLVGTGRHRPCRTLSPARVAALAAGMVAASVWWTLDGAGRVAEATTTGEPTEWLPAYLSWFAVGILLALLQVRQERRPTGQRPGRLASAVEGLARQPGVCWTLAGALLLMASTPIAGPTMLASSEPTELLTKNLLYAAVGGLVVLTGAFPDASSAYQRTMAAPLGRRLGWISYGIFCLHLPILHLVMWTTGWPLFEGRGPAVWALTVAISLVAAEAAYRVVERPALRLKGIRPGGWRSGASKKHVSTPTTGSSAR